MLNIIINIIGFIAVISVTLKIARALIKKIKDVYKGKS